MTKAQDGVSGLDTSGVVRVPRGKSGILTPTRYRWSDLLPFEQGYVRAALDELNARIRSGQIAPMPGPCRWAAFSDLAPSALARMLDDCRSFVNVATGLGIKKLGEVEGRYFWGGRQSGTLQGPFAAAYPKTRLYLTPEGKVDCEVAR